MILTVEEAKKRWCPFVRLGVHAGNAGVVAVSRHPDPAIREDLSCIGASCMAWQWTGRQSKTFPQKVDFQTLVDAGLDPGAIIIGREVTIPAMTGKFEALSGQVARISNVGRDAETKMAFVDLAVITGGDERVGRCGLCSPEGYLAG